MAIAFVQEVGSGGDSASSASFSITVSATTTIGNLLVVGIALNGGSVSTVTDSGGNTWTVDKNTGAGSTVHAAIASTVTIAALTSGVSTITVTPVASQRVAMSVQEWSGIGASPADLNSTGTATGTSADSGATATLNQADELVYGVIAHVSTVSSFTPEVLSPVWDQRTSAATTGTVRTVRPMSRVVSATTAVSAKATWTTSREHEEIVQTYKASGAVSTVPGISGYSTSLG